MHDWRFREDALGDYLTCTCGQFTVTFNARDLEETNFAFQEWRIHVAQSQLYRRQEPRVQSKRHLQRKRVRRAPDSGQPRPI